MWATCFYEGYPGVVLVHSVVGAEGDGYPIADAWAPFSASTTFGRATMQVMKGQGWSQKVYESDTKVFHFFLNTAGTIIPILVGPEAMAYEITTTYALSLYVVSLGLDDIPGAIEYGTSINVQWNDKPSSGSTVNCWGIVRTGFPYGSTETLTINYGRYVKAGTGPGTYYIWGSTSSTTISVTVENVGR